ncbi:MAG TPA: sensor histidine kinase, partial [Myxococcales bacterium]|nr:sensor histidine kinase [Myxococcales bacterium]
MPVVESAARINLRWIVRLRWGAVAGQVITIVVAGQFLLSPLPVTAMLGVCGALAMVNVAVQAWLESGGRPGDAACALNLLADIAALTALLALAGGRENPFAVLYLVHITIGAVTLPARWSMAVAAASVLAYSALQLLPSQTLHLAGDAFLTDLRGRWIAFVVGALFI